MMMRKQEGMALLTVMVMLVIMTTVGMGMYKLVQSTIGVSAGYYRKATTRTVAVAQAGMMMETISNSITGGTLIPVAGLSVPGSYSGVYADMSGGTDNDNASDTPEINPDFTFTMGNVKGAGDVDYIQTIPMAGGSIEFASAYDGVGQGQTMGSSYLTSNIVRIVTKDTNGGRTEVRFIAEQ